MGMKLDLSDPEDCTAANRYAQNRQWVPDRLGRMKKARMRNATAGVVLLTVLLLSGVEAAFAQPFEAVGSRALGMGGAFVAVADDASGTFWNPAGLASGQPAGATIEWSRLQKGDREASADAGPWSRSTRFTSLGTWPLGLSYTRVDEVSIGEEGRVHRFTTQDYALSMLQTLTEGLVVGSTLKYVRGKVGSTVGDFATVEQAIEAGEGLPGRSSGAFDIDLSAMYDARIFRIGYTIRNMKSPAFDDDEGGVRELQRRSRVGLALLPTSGLTLAIDLDLDTADLPSGPQRVIAAGAEHRLSRLIVIRGGVRRNLEGLRTTVGAAGASIAVKPGTWIDAHMTLGRSAEERGFGIGLRAGW